MEKKCEQEGMMALGRSPEYHWNLSYTGVKIGQGHNLNKLCKVCVFNAIYHFNYNWVIGMRFILT